MRFNDILIVSGSVFIKDLPAFLQSLNSFSKQNDIEIQGFDARKIVDPDHLLFAVHRARCAFNTESNEAKDIGLETLRFSSGQKQIGKAFSMGLVPGENRSYFVFFGYPGKTTRAKDEFLGKFGVSECADFSLDEKKPFLMEQFGITDAELKAADVSKLKDLVLERVALVDITR